MLPPETIATTGGANAGRVGQHGGDRGHPGRLDDELGPLQAEQQRPGEVLLGDRAHLVDQLGAVGEGEFARRGHRDPVGHRRHGRQRDRPAGGQGVGERRGALGLDGDDPDVGTAGLDGGRDPGRAVPRPPR